MDGDLLGKLYSSLERRIGETHYFKRLFCCELKCLNQLFCILT